jgi:hypothetical protein
MKRTLQTILIATTFLTLLFTSCNADASAGLFRQIADSKAPVGIRYKQIIGKDGTYLYFITNDGIYKSTGPVTTSVRANGKLKPVHYAYVDGTTLVYVANSSAGTEVGQYDLTSGTDTTQSHPTNAGYNEYVIKGVYANKLFLLEGKDTSNKEKFSLADYVLGTNTLTDKVTIDASADGLKLHSVLQMSGLQQKDISATHPMILSFVKADKKTYQHFYTDGTALIPWELTLDKNRSLAAFTISGGNLYVITEDGNLYEKVGLPTAADGALTHKKDLGKSYSPNAFMYAVKDGTTTHLITKTNTETEGLFVITRDTGADTTTTTPISDGYASQMKNVNIVSAFKKPSGDLLIATEKNGMFDISITDAATGAGTSKGPEDYTI